MNNSGRLIRSFLGTLAVLVAIGLFIRGYSFSELPWQIYGPGAALLAFFNVYFLPWFKKRKTGE